MKLDLVRASQKKSTREAQKKASGAGAIAEVVSTTASSSSEQSFDRFFAPPPGRTSIMVSSSRLLLPLSGVDILRLCAGFLAVGLGFGCYLQYCGELIQFRRKQNPFDEPADINEVSFAEPIRG